jgi:hypothetical protein
MTNTKQSTIRAAYRLAYWKQPDLSDVRVMRRYFHDDDPNDPRPTNLVNAGYVVSIVDGDASYEAIINELRERGYHHSKLEPGFYVS